MSIAGSIEALYEEALQMLDREAEIELREIGREFLQWLDQIVPRMPCDNWRYQFDRFIAKLARDHVIVAEESCQEWIQWLQEANDAARLDGRQPGSPAPVQFYIWEGKYDPPNVTSNKPAPFDPDYPQLRASGNAIMEHNPPEQWVELAPFWLDGYRVPQEIKDAFVGWLENEQRTVLGVNLSPRAITATGPADDPNYAVCFAAGTRVLTRRGQIAIESVIAGDEVWAVPDTDPLAAARWCRVERAYHNAPTELVTVHFERGDALHVSLNHPIFVREKGFVAAQHLRPGDPLRTTDDRWVSVSTILRNGGIAPVYNLSVNGRHTYFAGGVLVHNESPPPVPAAHEAPVPQMQVGVNIFLWPSAKGGYPNYQADIDAANRILAQAGISVKVYNVVKLTPEQTAAAFGLPSPRFRGDVPLPVFDPKDAIDSAGALKKERTILSPPGTVNVHYVPYIAGGAAGQAYALGHAFAVAPVGRSGEVRPPRVFAHELSHVLGIEGHVTDINEVDRLMVGGLTSPVTIKQQMKPEQWERFLRRYHAWRDAHNLPVGTQLSFDKYIAEITRDSTRLNKDDIEILRKNAFGNLSPIKAGGG